MERAAVRRGALRMSSSLLLVLALLCFLLPFATVGCDGPRTYQGIDFIDGDPGNAAGSEDSGEADPESVLGSGAAPITLAVVFAALGAILGLVPGLAAAAAAYAAAAVTAGALVAFLLSGSLRGFSSLFVDYRYGFWPALALSSAASVVAWLRWEAFPRVVRGRPLLAGFTGVALLTLAALVAQATSADPDVEGVPDVIRGSPLATALAPGFRRGEAWDAGALVGVPFLAAAALLLLARQPSRLAAWALLGLGVGWTLAALQDAAYFAASDHYGVGDGTYLGLLGGVALSGAGLGAARSSAGEGRRFDLGPRALVIAGAVGAVAGTLVPIERGGGREAVALLHGGHSATRWLALQPIVLALLAVSAAWLLPRARAAAALIGLAGALLFTYAALLSPLFDQGEDTPTNAGAGAFIGAAGAILILAGALIALRQRPD